MVEETARVVGVARLANFIKGLIENAPGMKGIAVRGEISNLHMQRGSGHCYFILKERNAVLNCIVLARDVPDLPPLREGAKVVASGALTTFEAQSRYQLRATAVRFEGEGDLFAAFEMLRAKLAAEGLFALERKRPLPAFPFIVALVSSATAEGAHDFRTLLRQRAPHIDILFFETAVQGEHAPSQIVAALRLAGESAADVVVLVRGGGSFEDLFAFSHEAVVRAIAACPKPVMTGIGHESDVSLADHVADLRASTPTDAATRLPVLHELHNRIALFGSLLERRQERVIGAFRERVSRLERRLDALSPRARLQERARSLLQARMRLDTAMRERSEMRSRFLERLFERFNRSMDSGLQRCRHRVLLAATALNGRDPHALLELGYAILRVDGRVVKDARMLPIGTLLMARLAHGTVEARVETTVDDERETTRRESIGQL